MATVLQQLADFEAARDSLRHRLMTGDASVVEYEIRGRRVKRDVKAAFDLINGEIARLKGVGKSARNVYDLRCT